MSEMQFTTVDRVLAKFHRDLRGTNINESDAIEWIGEALGFLKVHQIQEEAVAFLEVNNYETIVPTYFNMVIQLARKNNYVKNDSCEINPSSVSQIKCNCKSNDIEPKPCMDKPDIFTDCQGSILDDRYKNHLPYFDLQWNFDFWRNNQFYQREFTPIKLSNSTFFNSVVCKEHNRDLYRYCTDEYTIVGTIQKKLRFSFEKGLVALSYLRTAIDNETGYPLIPDNESYLAAITYYVKWKIAEWYQWNGREGFQGSLVSDMERKWIHYARQAKNYSNMPKSIDDYQSILEQSYSLPNLYKYYNFFGNSNVKRHPHG